MRYLIFLITALSFEGNKPKTAPPNTIILTDKLYIDQTPVSNQDWHEYLFNVANGRIETNKEIPYLNPHKECYFVNNDSIAGKVESLFKNNEFIEFQLGNWHFDTNSKEKASKYNKTVSIIFEAKTQRGYNSPPIFYPVLGVDLKEAEDYCQWRTKVVMYLMSLQSKRKREREFTKIQYRVPTNEEMALAKSKYPSMSEQAYYISKPEVDLQVLNHKFVELTANNDIDSLKTSNKKVGFRCACTILDY